MSMVQINHPKYGLLPINVTPEKVAARTDAVLLKCIESTDRMIAAGFGSEMSHAYLALMNDEFASRAE